MQTLILALLLAAIFGLFVPAVQNGLRALLHRRPATVWAIPVLLAAVFGAASATVGAFQVALTGYVLAYTLAPVACVWIAGGGEPKTPGVLDFLAIALLWFPLEFAGGVAGDIPRQAQGFL